MKLTMKFTPRLRRIIIAVVSFFLAYTLVGFVVLPYGLKAYLLKKLPEVLSRDVGIEKIRFNPYNLKLRIEGFAVNRLDGAGDFLSFDELYINLQSASIIKLGPIVKEFRLTGPFVSVTRRPDMTYSFSDLIPAEKGPAAERPSRPLVFSINNIQITGAAADFEDLPKGKTHTVRDLTINLPFISNLPGYIDFFIQPSFSAKVNDTPFELSGETKPFADSLETTVDIRLDDLDLAYYMAYSPVPLGFELVSALMSLDVNLFYTQYVDRPPALTLGGSLGLRDVVMKDPEGREMAVVPALDVKVTFADLFSRRINISKVSVVKPSLNFVRERDGKLNVGSLLPGGTGKRPGKAAPSGAFSLAVLGLSVDDASLSFTDLSTPTTFRRTVAPVDVEIKEFTTSPEREAKIEVSYRGKSKETLKVKGVFSVNPPSAGVDLDLRNMDITGVRSYIDEKIRIVITSGKASASGRVGFSSKPGEGPKTRFRGSMNIARFRSISKADSEDFLNWESLAFSGVDVATNPLYVSIDGVALTEFYSRIIIDPEGRLNVQEVMVREAPEGEAPAEAERKAEAPKEAADISIDTVTLQGGHVNFSDRHIKPGFSAELLEIGGRVSGLKSAEGVSADVDLIGKLDKYAPLEITGKINPLGKDLFVDLKLDFKDFDLSAMTPYAGRYVGYEIAKGKLILDLEYLIEKRKLDSKNSIILDQITFGEKVESPQATKLPVRFALNLLKDRRGQVVINFPVSGSLDDPEFRIGGIVVRIVVSFITRAVTSPFALLGAIIGGGGEELQYVEFDYGSYAVTGRNADKLDSIAEALYERPGLTLEIAGYTDREQDSEALRAMRFDRAVKSEKLDDMLRRKEPAVPVDEVEVPEKEYPEYLWKAYKKADFPKPKNFLGFTKKLPVEEMEKLMLTNIKITEDDLRELVSRRSKAVKDHILAIGKVEPERIYITWPESLEAGEKKDLKRSRVEFSLR